MTRLVMRLLFRGIYFPQMNKRALHESRPAKSRPILSLAKEGLASFSLVEIAKVSKE